MTKSTITREQLDEWVAQFDEDGGCDATDRQLEALIRQSLAAIDSEPVAWTWHYREQWHVTNDKCRAEFVATDGDVAVLPLYRHAQPAPKHPEVLPCSVLLEPGLRFGKGIKTSTMLAALARRAVHESDMAALSPEERAEFQAGIEGFKSLIAQQPAVPDEKPTPNSLSMYAVDAVAAIAEVRGWNACRAAMLQGLKKSAGTEAVCRSSDNAQVLTSINPAPTLVSLPKNAKSLTGNSPVIGIDLASGPDRTVEVHYVVPPGYVVVPKEPTDEMIAAAMNCEDVLFNSDDSFCVQFVNIYEAMLAAAPKEVK